LALPDSPLHKVWLAPLKASNGDAAYTLLSRKLPTYLTSWAISPAIRWVREVTIG
jgi:hypothetical protein